MKVYVLVKRYSDNSGFAVCGVTTDRAIAQAFYAGGEDGAASAEVFERDTESSVFLFNEAPAAMSGSEL